MSKDKFTGDWPTEDGYYLFPEPATDGIIGLYVNMKDGIAYYGNTPLEHYLEFETLKMFCGPMSKEECEQKLRKING